MAGPGSGFSSYQGRLSPKAAADTAKQLADAAKAAAAQRIPPRPPAPPPPPAPLVMPKAPPPAPPAAVAPKLPPPTVARGTATIGEATLQTASKVVRVVGTGAAVADMALNLEGDNPELVRAQNATIEQGIKDGYLRRKWGIIIESTGETPLTRVAALQKKIEAAAKRGDFDEAFALTDEIANVPQLPADVAGPEKTRAQATIAVEAMKQVNGYFEMAVDFSLMRDVDETKAWLARAEALANATGVIFDAARAKQILADAST